jgi:hypothetical protein
VRKDAILYEARLQADRLQSTRAKQVIVVHRSSLPPSPLTELLSPCTQVNREDFSHSGGVSARSRSFALSSSLSLSKPAYDVSSSPSGRAQSVCLKTPEQLLKRLFVKDLFGHHSSISGRADEPDEHEHAQQHLLAQHYLQQDENNTFYTEKDALICRPQVSLNRAK